jgi:alkylation response protein AidB-like acyl-CoA dehydrogenase
MKTDLHDELLGVVRDLTQREVAPRSADLDAGDRDAFAHCWTAACAIGLDRVLLAEEFGGAGLGPADLLAMIEEMAAGDAGLAVAVLLHNVALAALPAEAVAAVADGERWSVTLPPLAPSLAFGISKGSAGVSGRIPFVPGALGAGGFAILDPAPGSAALFFHSTAPGLTIQPYPFQMGWRSSPAAGLVLDEVTATPVPHSVGSDSGATRLVRLGVSAVARGIAWRAWEWLSSMPIHATRAACSSSSMARSVAFWPAWPFNSKESGLLQSLGHGWMETTGEPSPPKCWPLTPRWG